MKQQLQTKREYAQRCFMCHTLHDDDPVQLCAYHRLVFELRLYCFLARTRQLGRWTR